MDLARLILRLLEGEEFTNIVSARSLRNRAKDKQNLKQGDTSLSCYPRRSRDKRPARTRRFICGLARKIYAK
jgi:hypothetical protein